MSLDIPDQVRKTVIADGNESWLDELPGVVDSLAQEWSLMIGPSFAGGHAALVVEVTLVDGTPAVLKIGVPGRDVGQEAMVLRLANGGDAPNCWAKTWVDKPFSWSALGLRCTTSWPTL
jgi:streptomycin 6-kinase